MKMNKLRFQSKILCLCVSLLFSGSVWAQQISATPDTLVTTEGNNTGATFAVSLTRNFLAGVTFTIEGLDPTEHTSSPASHSLTQGGAVSPPDEVFTIRSVNDTVADGTVSYTAYVVAESLDLNFTGGTQRIPITLVNRDNEAGVVFRIGRTGDIISSHTTMESAVAQQLIGLTLTEQPQPAGSSVTVSVTVGGDSDEISLNPQTSTRTFTSTSYGQPTPGNPHVIAFAPVNDAIADGNRPYTFDLEVTASTATNYPVGTVFSLPGINEDDEAASDTTAPTLSSTMTENTTVTLTYSEELDFTSVPSSTDYTLTVTPAPTTGNEITLSSVSISGQDVILTLSRAPTDTENLNLTYVVPSTNPVQDLAATPNTAAAFADEPVKTAGLSVSIADVTVDENVGNAAVTVTVAGTSTAPITATVTTTDGTATATEDYTAPSNSLTIPTGDTTATIMIPITNDGIDEGTSEDFTVTLSGLGGGGGVLMLTLGNATATVTITDDDTAGFTVSIGDGVSTSENMTTDSFTVALDSQPTANVELLIGIDASEHTVTNPTLAILTFTTSDWATAQQVTLTGVNDDIADGDQTYNLMLMLRGGGTGTGYGSVTLPTVEVTNTDNDTAPDSITLSIDPLTVAETADATTITVTATLGGGSISLPTQTDITVSVGDGSDSATEGTDYATIPDLTLTIPAEMTSATGTFMIDPTDDSTTEGEETVTIEGSASPGSFTFNSPMLTIVEAGVSVYDEMTAGTEISTSTVTIAEAGSDTLYVQLTSQPAANVVIGVTSDDTNEGMVTPAALTFSTTNWATRQAVTVNAVNDNVDRNGDSFTVGFAVTTGDSGNYTNSLTLPSVAVTVTDNDTAGLTVVDGGGVTTSETGTTDTFTVVLDSEPTDTVTVTISGLDGAEHTLDPVAGTLTFTTTDWSTVQTVTLTGVNDNDVDGDQTSTLTLTPTGGGYTGVTAPTVSVTNTDDDTAELTIADMSVNEGAGTATVTVTLTPAVTAGTVTVDATTADGTATAGTDYTAITSQTLTFTAGSTSETLSITINDDSIVEVGETFTVMLDNLMLPTGVTTVTIATDDTAEVTITDDDTAGITTAIGDGVTTSETGATADTFTVVLDSEPTDTVTVTISGLDGAEHTLDPVAGTLTFTTTDWSTAQTVTLNSVDDNIVDGDQTYTLTLTPTGGGYTGVTAPTVSVTNTDTDTAELTIADMSVNEDAGTATVTVTLSVMVTTGDVTVDATTADGTATAGGDYTAITSQTLTFTGVSTSETLDITISDDDIDEIDETFTVMLNNLVPLTGVTIATDDTATVTITDDETTPTAITLSVNPSTIVETASATEITVTAAIDGTVVLPTATDVAVTVGGGTATVTTDYTATPSTLTITIPALAASATGTFMITPVDDSMSDNNETVEISGTAGGFTVSTATLTIIEAGILVFDAMMDGSQISTATIDEASGSDILYVQLTSQPASDVTLSVTSDDTNEGMVTPAALTFSTTNWATRQAVTVTAVDDDIDRDDSFTVDFAVTTGDSGNYTTSLTLPSVTVTVTDDDTVGITTAIGDGVTTSETGTTDTFTVVLDSEPTDTVTVTISGLDGAEHTLDPVAGTLTFTTTDWSTVQTVTLTGVNDNDVDGDQTSTLTLTPTGGGYTGVTAPTVSVTNTDDDTAELTIADMSVNEGAGTATVTVTLTPAVTAGTVTVDATTADGTATAGTDYTAITSQTLTFTAGSTSETLSITINDDSIVEVGETFTVMLDNLMLPTGVTTVTIATDDTAEVTITDDDTAGITTAIGDGVTTSETGATADTFTVVLDSEPTDTVTVTISGLDGAEHTLDPVAGTLTFTTTDWSTAQTVTLNSVDDNIVDGDQTYTLTLTPTGGGYTGVTAPTVSVTNTDTDTAELTIADMSVDEDAGTATVTVTLSVMVTTGDVTVDATTADGTATAGGDYTAITSQTLTFTGVSTSETLDITISDDDIDEIDETFTVMLNNLVPLTGVTIATDDTATVTITDDETTPTAITLSVNPSTIVETASATEITVTAAIDGTVVLPTATDVAVTVGGGTATVTTDYTATPSTLTITIPALAASATGTFMITPVDDSMSDNNETVEISGTAGGFTVSTATLTIIEAGILVFDAMMDGSQISTATIDEASGSDILYVQLTSQPASDVTLSVTSDDTNEGMVTPAALTFSTTNWATRQAVTVTAVDDDIDRDDSFTVDFAVTTGDSGNYTTSLTLPSVTVTVTDDDTVGITTAIGDGVTTSETGTTDTFTVVLDSEPTDTVTVTISGLDGAEHTLDPVAGTLTFTTTDWSTVQTVTLTGVNDNDVDGDQTSTLTLTPTGGGYTGVTAPTVSVTNTDDDTAELTIADMSVNEGAGTATVTVTLTPAVTAGTVTVDATTADGTATAGTDYTAITSQTLTFTAGSTSETLSITINDDSIVEVGETFTVMLDNLMLPTGVTTVTIATDDTAEVTITDDDTAGITTAIGDGVTTSETGATADTFTVVLDSEPTDTVTVTISGLDGAEHTLDPVAGTLTFTTTDWSTAQTVTLNSVDDNIVDGDQTYTLTLTPTGGGYTGVTAPTVSVTNTDTDTAELTIADMSVNEDAGTATVTVTLSVMVTTGDVTVDATTADGTATAGGDYTAITSQTLTFTGVSTSETLDITISDDDIDEIDETFTVMLNNLVPLTGVTIATDDTATVTITDDETTPTAITLSVNPSTIVETASATEITVTAAIDGTVVLPTATDVAVTVGGGTATVTTDYTATPSTLTITIPALAASATGTFMITPVDDSMSDNNETVEISGTAGGFTVSTATLTIIEAGILVFDAMMDGSQISTATIDEASGSDILYVQLTSQPASDVTLSVTSDDTNEGMVTPAALTFSTTNWATRQAVTVTAVDDDIDRDDSFTVDFAVTTGDSGNYTTSLTLPSVTVTVTDDDTVGITTAIGDGVTTSETGTTDTFTVVLDSEPTDTVTVTISGLDGAEHTLDPVAGTLTFTTTDWSTVQTVTLTGVNDNDVDGDQTSTLTLTPTGGGYTGVTAPTVSVTNEDDNDTATLSIADLTVDENAGTATLTVTLDPFVTATGDITVDLTTADGTATAGEDYTAITSQTLTFAMGSAPQTLDITISDDSIAENDETFTVMLDNLVTPTGVTVVATDTATVTITDDETAPTAITLSISQLTIPETASATEITVTATIDGTAVLPTATDVAVSVGGGTATVTTDYTATPTTLTITIPALAASATQTFMITPVDDTVDDSGETVEISGTAASFTVSTATLTIVEAGILAFDAMTLGSQISTATIAEASGTDMLYVQLASQPAGNVTLSVASSATGEGTVAPPTLTFSNTNWDTRQAVTVTAVPDDIDRDDTFTVDFAVTSGDGANYTSSLALSNVTVTITDDDTAGLALFDATTAGSLVTAITTGEPNTATTFYVELTSQPTADVTVAVTSDTLSEGQVTTGASLTFNSTNWNMRQAVTITGQDDNNVDGDQSYIVTLSSTSTDTNYNALTDTTVTATNTDTDTAELTIADMSVDEDAGTATVTVTLSVMVTTGDVTVDATTADGTATAGGDYTAITSQTLTFTGVSTSETLDITISDDDIDEIDETFTVMLNNLVPLTGVTIATDDTATVTITDDETTPTAITLSVNPSTVAETASATEITVTAAIDGTVVLSTATDVTVSVGGGTATVTTDYTLSIPTATLTITIPAEAASATGTFMITPADDSMSDNNETVEISGTAASFTVSTATLTIVEAGILVFDMASGNDAPTVEVAENGGTDTFYVELASQPAGNVTLSAASSTGEGTVSPGTLTFTTANWATRQAVTVTAVDDDIDRDDSFTVDFAVTTGDSGNYTTSLTLPSVTVTVTDDDTVGITTAIGDGVTTSETGTTDTFTVVLDSEPTDTVTVTISGLDGAEHTLDPVAGTLTFTTTDWSTVQTVTLTGVNDNDVDGDQTSTLTLTPTGGGYTGVTAPTVSVTNTDDDTAELTIADMSVNEGAGTATVTVTLTPAVTAGTVTVDATTADGTATAGTDYTAITSQTLTFTAGSTSETLSITINDDSIVEVGETFTVMLDNLMLPTGVTTVTIATDDTAEVTITDDETAPTAITLSISQLTIPETASATEITVTATIDGTAVLPTATDVAVSVGGGTATVTTDYTATPTTLTITIPALAASATQTFMITPVDDTVDDSGETVEISGTAASFTVSTATLTIVEAGILAFDAMTLGSQISTATIAEASGTDMLYVQLANQPAGDVTLSVASSATGEGTVAPPTLTFSNTNWDTRQAVTVTAVPDDIDRDDTFTVDFAVTGGDGANYTTSLDLSSVIVTITDDDTAGITTAIGDGVTTSETGATADTFTVVLDSEPTDTVTVTISGLDGAEHTLDPVAGTLTFTTTDWSTAQTVTLNSVDDNIVDGDQTYTLTLTPTGGGYTGVTAPTVSVTNTDTDTAELTIADMSVDEDAGTATVTVTLSVMVTTGDVTVNATTADGTATAGGDYTAITSQTLTFAAGSTTQTLSITISDDSTAEGNETFTVMLSTLVAPTGVTIAASPADTATVTITDDETAPTTIDLSINPSTVAETADATTITVTATIDGTVVLPTDTVVTVSVGGGTATVTTDYTATPTTLNITIPALAASATGTFMIDPVDDGEGDSGDTVMISGTATGFTVSTTTLTIVEAGILVFDAMMDGSQISTATIAEASSDILYVQLASQPAANVVIGVTSSATGEGTVSTGTLTFTNTNWDTRQALTATAVNDNIDRDGDSFMVDFMITSGDSANYTSSLALSSVAVTVTDDDTLSNTINLSVNPSTVAETAGDTLITVTATLGSAVVSTTATAVTVSVGGGTASPNTDYMLSTSTGTITLPTGTITITIPEEMTRGSGTFTITPEADDVSDNGETVMITGMAGGFTTINPATLRIIEFSEEDQQAIEQTVAAQASGITQVVTEQIGLRLASRTSVASTQERQSLSAINWQDDLAKFTYEGLKRLDSEADMSLDWLLRAAGGNGQLLMPLGVESLTLWATGGRISTKGDGVADYDGDVNSFILGIDTALANDWLAGIAVSYNDSEVDYTMNGTGKTEQTLYGFHPYLSRTLSKSLTLWATGGYGFGDVDFSHTNHGQATSDVTQWMAAGGLEQQIITNSPWQGALRIKGLWGNAEVDSATYNRGATIAKVDTDFWRAHMESEMGYNFPLSGANIRPYALVGARWDHNDAIVSGDEWHIDVGGGVELSDNDFALNISVRTQVTDGDTEEDSIFATGSLTYDLGQDGQGLQIALSRPLNNTSPAFDSYSFNEVTESGLSGAPLTSELAYGWTVRPFGLKGALQTYVQNSFESSDRHYAVGLELAVNALTLNFETGYHDHTSLNSGETDNTGLESMFKTKIRW